MTYIDTNTVCDWFISAAIFCITSSSRQSLIIQMTVGLPANGESANESTMNVSILVIFGCQIMSLREVGQNGDIYSRCIH